MKRSVVTLTIIAAFAAALPLHAQTERLWVDSLLEQFTLSEKVAQMMMPWIEGGGPRSGSAEWRRVRRFVQEHDIGGVIVGRGDAIGTATWLNTLQEWSDVPLLVGADLEWGAGTRLEGATILPTSMALAAAGDPGYAFSAGRITAREARAAGVHLAFAPVADVNVNPANPVINTRSFGADPYAVAQYVSAFIEGARAGGMLTTAKHFPGHGDTRQDSHITMPLLSVSRARIHAIELVPFRAAIHSGVDAIMTAHLAVPALETAAAPRPATLSPSILTGLLRSDLGFGGLVITDALTMDGVGRDADPGRVAVEAVMAGADILLMPPNTADAIAAVVSAVRSGEIDAARIDASVRRILEAKVRVGLHDGGVVSMSRLRAMLEDETHRRWAEAAADRSVTLARNDPRTLPYQLKGGTVPRVLSIAYSDGRSRDINEAFDESLADLGALVESRRLWRRSSDRDLAAIEAAARDADVVIFSSYARAVPWRGELGIPEDIAALANRLGDNGAITISFGDPYVLEQLPDVRTYLLAWSDAEVAQRAAARAIAGEVEVAGMLPIPLPPHHALGDGLRTRLMADDAEPALVGPDDASTSSH